MALDSEPNATRKKLLIPRPKPIRSLAGAHIPNVLETLFPTHAAADTRNENRGLEPDPSFSFKASGKARKADETPERVNPTGTPISHAGISPLNLIAKNTNPAKLGKPPTYHESRTQDLSSPACEQATRKSRDPESENRSVSLPSSLVTTLHFVPRFDGRACAGAAHACDSMYDQEVNLVNCYENLGSGFANYDKPLRQVSWIHWNQFPGPFNGVLIPQIPNSKDLCARMPDPPKLNWGIWQDQIPFIRTSYYSVKKHFWPNDPIPWAVFTPNSKYYLNIRDAIDALRQENISPAEWFLLSFRVWKFSDKTPNRRMPPIRWTFSVKRIKKVSIWKPDFGMLSTGKLWPGVYYEEINKLHTAMREDLELHAGNEAQAREIVERYFPGKTYQRLRDLAREEARIAQESLNLQAERGEFLWF